VGDTVPPENANDLGSLPQTMRRWMIPLLCVVLFLTAAVGLMRAVVGSLELGLPGATVPAHVTGIGYHPTDPGDVLPPGVTAPRQSTPLAEIYVEHLPAGLRLLTVADDVVVGLSLAVGALLLWRVLLSISSGRPFDARNPRRLGWLAVVLATGWTGGSLLASMASYAVLTHVGLDALDLARPAFPPLPDLTGLWLALIASAFAVAFRHGRQLAADAEGLV
jgi:hypothetical protein